MVEKDEVPQRPGHEAASPGGVRRVSSADLFRGGRSVIIEHAGESYCLRLTRNERLILTKD